MAELIYRSVKGSVLTKEEGDANTTEIDRRTGQGWSDIVSDITTRGGANSPPLTNFIGGIYLYEFLTGQDYEFFANFHVRHDYVLGTMIYPHMHFSVTSNLGGVVRWVFEYTQAQRHDDSGTTVFVPTTTLYLNFTIPPNSAYKHLVAEMPEGQGIPGTNIDFDSMIMMRVYREGTSLNDTFTQSIFGITCDLHYEADRFTTPNRAPPFI